jgi:predicted nucleic acid-binding protein
MIVLPGWTNFCGKKIGVQMNKPPIVVVDADAIIAQTNPVDIHHQRADTISQNLIALNAQVVYPVTAVAEAATHIQRVLNSTVGAYGTAQLMTETGAQVAEVTKQTLATALKYFSPTTSKKNTLFDCIVAAVAEEYKADAIFSFDHFYVKRGFELAENLLP